MKRLVGDENAPYTAAREHLNAVPEVQAWPKSDFHNNFHVISFHVVLLNGVLAKP